MRDSLAMVSSWPSLLGNGCLLGWVCVPTDSSSGISVFCHLHILPSNGWDDSRRDGTPLLGWAGGNEGTSPGQFPSPSHGCSVRNHVLHFYFSHVSHRNCLIIDEVVRSWGHKPPPRVLSLMEKVLKESQRCYCNTNQVYLINNKHSQNEYTSFFFLCRK